MQYLSPSGDVLSICVQLELYATMHATMQLHIGHLLLMALNNRLQTISSWRIVHGAIHWTSSMYCIISLPELGTKYARFPPASSQPFSLSINTPIPTSSSTLIELQMLVFNCKWPRLGEWSMGPFLGQLHMLQHFTVWLSNLIRKALFSTQTMPFFIRRCTWCQHSASSQSSCTCQHLTASGLVLEECPVVLPTGWTVFIEASCWERFHSHGKGATQPFTQHVPNPLVNTFQSISQLNPTAPLYVGSSLPSTYSSILTFSVISQLYTGRLLTIVPLQFILEERSITFCIEWAKCVKTKFQDYRRPSCVSAYSLPF